MGGIRVFAVLGLAAAMLAGCSTPSEKYGLAPPSAEEAYPNINVDPTQASGEKPMTPEQLAAAQADLEKRAGKKPSAPSASAYAPQ